jgi:hypothetical protein
MPFDTPNTQVQDLLEIERNARAMQAQMLADMVGGLGRLIVSALRRKPATTHA